MHAIIYQFLFVAPSFLQPTPSPSCTAVSAGSFWRELSTPSSSRRATLTQANARTTQGKASDGLVLVDFSESLVCIRDFTPLLLFFPREFSSALEFLQLLNSCTEDSPSPPPPFSTPPNHTTTPGMNNTKRTALPISTEA